MRFSLKWILVAVAYVAVAAAAFSQTTWVYADVLWAASLLAVVYAGLIAAFARGRRQVAAAGFVVASVGFLVCLHFSNDSVPTRRLLAAANVGQPPQPTVVFPAPTIRRVTRPVSVTSSTSAGAVQRMEVIERVVMAPSPSPSVPTTVAVSPPPTAATQWMPQPAIAPATKYVDYSIYVRAGNAMGMMLFGGLGCLLGMAAYKAVRRDLVLSA